MLRTPKIEDNRQYHSSPTELNGTPDNLRIVRRLDAVARLFQFPSESPVTSCAIHNGKLILGFNSPRKEGGELEKHRIELKRLVSERIQLLKKYYSSKEDGIKVIWDLVSKLNGASRQTDKHDFEYPIPDIFTDLSKVYDAFYPTEGSQPSVFSTSHDSFLKENKEYMLELLKNNKKNESNAEETYNLLLQNADFANEHSFFKKDSLDGIFFSEEYRHAFKKEEIEIVVMPQIKNGQSYDTVHAEVAVANYILSDLKPFNKNDERQNIPIGISMLTCSDCSNFLNMVNSVFNDFAKTEPANEVKLPIISVAGTHSCEFSNWCGILPNSLFGIPALLPILKKYGIQETNVKKNQDTNTFQVSPARTKKKTTLVDDPYVSNSDIKRATLSLLPSDVISPSRKVKDKIMTPEISDYKSVSSKTRIEMGKLRDEKTKLLDQKHKTDIIHQSIQATVNSLATEAKAAADNKHNKKITAQEVITQLDKILLVVKHQETVKIIESNLEAIKQHDPHFFITDSLSKKYKKLEEDAVKLSEYYAAPERLNTIELELSKLQTQQASAQQNISKNLNFSDINNEDPCTSTPSQLPHPGFMAMNNILVPEPPKIVRKTHILNVWSTSWQQASASSSSPSQPVLLSNRIISKL